MQRTPAWFANAYAVRIERTTWSSNSIQSTVDHYDKHAVLPALPDKVRKRLGASSEGVEVGADDSDLTTFIREVGAYTGTI